MIFTERWTYYDTNINKIHREVEEKKLKVSWLKSTGRNYQRDSNYFQSAMAYPPQLHPIFYPIFLHLVPSDSNISPCTPQTFLLFSPRIQCNFKNYNLCCISFVTFSTSGLLPNAIYFLKAPEGAHWLFRKCFANPPRKGFSFVCILVAILKFSTFGLWYYSWAQSFYTEVVCFLIQWARPVCGCDTPVEGSQEPIVAILGKF